MNPKKSETQKCVREITLRLHKDGKSYSEIAKIVNKSKSILYHKQIKNLFRSSKKIN